MTDDHMVFEPDITDKPIPDHPGGQALLQLAANHERPDLLFFSHHLGCDMGRIRALAARREIAIPMQSEMFDELSAMVADVSLQHRRHESLFEIYCLMVTLAWPITYFGFAVAGSLAGTIAFGAVMLSYSFVIFHTRHHRGGKVYRHAGLDLLLRPVYDLLDEVFMVQPDAWQRQHQSSHHVYANDDVRDYDVYHPTPWIRLHGSQPHRSWHRYQSWYVPVLMLLNVFSFPITNITARGGKKRYGAIYFLLMLVIPVLLQGVHGLILYLVALAPASLMLSYLFQVSHNFTDLDAKPCTSINTYDDWTRSQVENATDYGGYLMTVFCGGINLQASHHVAPAVSPILLYFISPKLQGLMERRGVPFNRQRHFLEAVLIYHRRLNQLAFA